MKDRYKLLEEVRAFIDAADKAREDFYCRAVSLANACARNRDTIRDLKGTIGGFICDFIEADERYTKAWSDATEALERLSQFLNGGRKGSAE